MIIINRWSKKKILLLIFIRIKFRQVCIVSLSSCDKCMRIICTNSLILIYEIHRASIHLDFTG